MLVKIRVQSHSRLTKYGKAIQKMKAVIEDDNLNDFVCVDEIITILRGVGIRVRSERHDV